MVFYWFPVQHIIRYFVIFEDGIGNWELGIKSNQIKSNQIKSNQIES